MTQSLGSSGASGCYSELADFDRNSFEDSDEEDAFISFTTLESKCEQLFQRALELKIEGDLEQSLSYFLECLKGMQECQFFAKLPQTLHHLGNLCQSMNRYEEAIEYAKAEKLFYEAIIIQSDSRTGEGRKPKTKRRPFSKKPKPSASVESNPAEYGNLLIKKSEEFDSLARISMKENNMELALNYSGKAATLRQAVFGHGHPLTVASLEQFSKVYAEMGRNEYIKGIHQAGKGVNVQSHRGDHVPSSKGDLLAGESNDTNEPDGSPLSTHCGGTKVQFSTTRENNGMKGPIQSSLNKDISSLKCTAQNESPERNLIMFSGSPIKVEDHPCDKKTPLPNFKQGNPYTDSHHDPQECRENYTDKCNGHICEECRENCTDKFNGHICKECKRNCTDKCNGYICEECKRNCTEKRWECDDHTKGRGEDPLSSGYQTGHAQDKGEDSLKCLIGFQGEVISSDRLPQEVSLCGGVANNFTTKLSELKTPICVNLDLQRVKPGEEMAYTRCLPLWVLLLGASMALLTYVLYYH